MGPISKRTTQLILGSHCVTWYRVCHRVQMHH